MSDYAESPSHSPRNRSPFADAWRDLKELLALSFPVIIAMATHTLMGFVDTAMLASYGPNELAAVGASGVIAFTVIAFIFGTSNCTSTFVSQSMGRGELGECARYTWQGVYFGLAAQLLVIPIALGGPLIFAAFGHEKALQGLESQYFAIRMAHVAATAAYAALSSFFQGIGRPGLPMVAAIIANLFNAALDYVLIFGVWGFPEMGIRGAAIATTVASYLQVLILFGFFLHRAMHERFGTRSSWRLDLGRLRRLLWIGAPAGLNFMLDVASWAVFTNLLIGKLGRNILAANTATHSIMGLSFMPAVGLNKGVTVLVGQYIGRRNIPAAKRMAYLGIGVAMVFMVLMGLVFLVFREPLIAFFVRPGPKLSEAARLEIIRTGSVMLLLAALFQAFDAVGIVATGALRGAGDTRFAAVVCVASAWGILLPLGYALTFPAGLGYVGAWIAAAIHIAIVGLCLFWRFASEAWRKIDIFAG